MKEIHNEKLLTSDLKIIGDRQIGICCNEEKQKAKSFLGRYKYGVIQKYL